MDSAAAPSQPEPQRAGPATLNRLALGLQLATLLLALFLFLLGLGGWRLERAAHETRVLLTEVSRKLDGVRGAIDALPHPEK